LCDFAIFAPDFEKPIPMECMRDQFIEGSLLNGRYETLSPLNHGSFGMVFKARDIVTDEIVALKCLTKSGTANSFPINLAFDDRSEELKIHRRIGRHHRNIVNLYDTFETESHTYLVQEFCANGDLYEAIRHNRGPLETEHVRDTMRQLVDAVEFLHSKGVYHRDLKPENILLAQNGDLKVGDFGLATMDAVSFESAVGSDRYMAPEQLEPGPTGYSPAKADIWAIGICLLNILFARNPFATPTVSDPLFADFAGDRQTLFDVFPSMSQDTFEVLMPSLALDPNKRSLSEIRKALDRVISFTTDDAFMDEFCTEGNEVVGSTANREPLRTPSTATAQLDQNGAFPWARALALSPPQPIRQLSAIPDTESYQASMYGAEDHPFKQNVGSIASFVDSGLGVSIGSQVTDSESIDTPWKRSSAVAGSLPASASRPVPSMSSVFGKRDQVSKSWSEIWDEEEEELNRISKRENTQQFTGFKHRLLQEERSQDTSGNTTPRAGLSEMKNPAHVNNSRARTPDVIPVAADKVVDSRISEHTGFIFEDHHTVSVPKYSPPSKRSLLEKWEALGDRRRARTNTIEKALQSISPQTPSSKTTLNHTSVDSPASSAWQSGARKRSRAGSWRRNHITTNLTTTTPNTPSVPITSYNNHGTPSQNFHHNHQSDLFSSVWEPSRKDWNLSKDWRRPGCGASGVSKQQLPSTLRKQKSAFTLSAAPVDDVGDFEWVGGWHDLHL
jgi:serine/threonine protein kinase